MLIVFGSHPFEPRKPDPAFESEYAAAIATDLNVAIVSIESLFEERNPQRAVRWIVASPTAASAIYRGWMLSGGDYASLSLALNKVNVSLINSPEQYAACHYLPQSYPIIERNTAVSTWFETAGAPTDEQLRAALAPFGDAAVILKETSSLRSTTGQPHASSHVRPI